MDQNAFQAFILRFIQFVHEQDLAKNESIQTHLLLLDGHVS
jgi:hypothetical protein